jgi:hypothetical protein
MLKSYCYALFLVIGVTFHSYGQQRDLQTVPLNDLSAFRSQSGNWRIVGDVVMDPTIDVHPEATAKPAETAKKGKKSRNAPEPPKPRAVTYTDGTGILLNINDATKKDHLVTNLEHGDIEIELDVMLPKGSNSGIYLQGRYEVQLLDSWGVKNARYSDIGGIYRNWENEPGKIYMGKAPLTNAAKAPGLWQKMKISFQAPRFDANGKKIANARFNSVVLNGVKIHENVEVPLPTGGPLENNETAKGPLMIQGDHGPVAFRNIRYKLLKELDYKMGPVTYQVFHGNFKSTGEFAAMKPAVTGTSPDLSTEVVDVENAYGVRYNGEVTIPEDGRYTFSMIYTGGAKFTFNNHEFFNYPTPDAWRTDTASVTLKAGTYPYEIVNFKDASWMPPRLALYIRSSNSYPRPLHAINSYPPSDRPVSSIFIEPGKDPRLVRAFIDFKGQRSERLTHTIGVGDPSGVHYVYDLRSANIVCVWRGDFIDATPMWHDRGDGSFRPMGAPLFLFNNQALAILRSQGEAFPKAAESEFSGKGYTIEAKTNRPIFKLTYNDMEFEDRVFPDENRRVLSHEITLKKGNRADGLHYKLAEGSSISQMPDGSYAVDDKEYYIKVESGAPFVREVSGKKELVIAFPPETLKYSIIW